jgi:hypothetical protein
VALPALELHDALHRLAIDDVAGQPKARPDHPIAQVRLVVNEALDPLRQHLVDDRRPFAMLIIRRAARHVQ